VYIQRPWTVSHFDPRGATTLDYIKKHAFGLHPTADVEYDIKIGLRFEASEMDKQAVIQKFRITLNDHYKLTSSICNLTYMCKGGVVPTLAFNQKTVSISFAQDDSPLNIMRIAWICYHSLNETYIRAHNINLAGWSEAKIMTKMKVHYCNRSSLEKPKSPCVWQVISNEINHSRCRIMERNKVTHHTKLSLKLPAGAQEGRRKQRRANKSIFYVKKRDDNNYSEVGNHAQEGRNAFIALTYLYSL
jgi:hypothetical protein